MTRTPRGLRAVCTGYPHRPPACRTYRRRRAACPRGATHCTYAVRVPVSGVPYVSRTVAPQADGEHLDMADDAARDGARLQFAREIIKGARETVEID